jgi:hypothetical protein
MEGHTMRAVNLRFVTLSFATLGLVTLASIGGCSTLLPRSQASTQGGWQSFDEARDAIQQLKPYETRLKDLHTAGMDPYKNPTITILSYSDLTQRLAAGGALRAEQMERGIRDCLTAGKGCVGYQIVQRRVARERVGNFWMDSFNFRREINIEGWSFNALIVMVDDVVVFTLFGGQPKIHDHETDRNPLGPFQGWGEPVMRGVLGW